MKIKETLIVTAALLVSCNTFAADLRATFDNVIVTLKDTACVNHALVDQIVPQYVPEFHAGSVVVTNKEAAKELGRDTFELCWIEKDGEVFLLDEIGNQLQFPKAMFAAPAGV
jgi:hypothetical protein